MRIEQLVGTCALIGATLAFNVGCAARARASAHAEVDAPVVFVEPPTLVLVESDVWVVRDCDYAVYYTDDYYWVRRDGVWYRSRTYEGGWVTVELLAVPRVVAQRDHHLYVRYHGSASARTRVAPRGYATASRSSKEGSSGAVEERRHGPPEHAAAKHGGPPGHHEQKPGVGNQRKAETGVASNATKHDKQSTQDKKSKHAKK